MLLSVFILSVNASEVYKLMKAAWALGYIQTGEYVFFDMDFLYYPGDYLYGVSLDELSDTGVWNCYRVTQWMACSFSLFLFYLRGHKWGK